MRKKLCRAGSCPFPHFSTAGIDPHLHPGSRGGRRDRLSAEEGVGQIIWQLMEKGVLGTFIYLKNILSEKSTTGFFVSPPPSPCLLGDAPCPLSTRSPAPPGWLSRTDGACGVGGQNQVRISLQMVQMSPLFGSLPPLRLDPSTWASLPSTLLAPFCPSVFLSFLSTG